MIATGVVSRNKQQCSAGGRGPQALLILTLAFVMLLAGTPAFAAHEWPENDPRFDERNAIFDRLETSTSLGNMTSQGQVIAAGNGVFHAIAVQSAAPPYNVVYQRSTDGGRTWDHRRHISKDTVNSNVLGSGDLAVSGDHVAIAYLGATPSSDPDHPQADSVFLIESYDAGVSWSNPRQISSGTSTSAQVAVDGEHTWVAYDVIGVATRVWSNQSASVPMTCGGDPQIAAEGGVVVVTTICEDKLTAAVGQFDHLGPFKTVITKTDEWSMVVNGVAVADGTAHILVSNRHRAESATDIFVADWHADPGGSFEESPIYQESLPDTKDQNGYVHTYGSDTSARLAAGRGTVAVTVVHGDSEVQLYTSVNQGTSFTGPTFVAEEPPGSDLQATVTVAVPEHGVAQPRFSWKIDPHYLDTNGDGYPEPANISGNANSDAILVGDNKYLTVHLDGCGSLPPATSTIETYTWKVGDDELASGPGCEADLELQSGQIRRIRLTVTMADGTEAATEQDVEPRDLVIASLGDGVASGDGNPNKPDPASPVWDDAACHRSAIAGPARAAEEVEKADDHTSVTFIQLACSGAALLDTTDDPASAPAGSDDMNDGGILDAYAGGDPDLRRSRPSQLDDLETVLTSRHLDTVMISAGAEDIRLRALMDECAHNQPFGYCQNSTLATQVPARIAQLPSRFDQLATRLDAVGGGQASVYLTEYADPTRDERGINQMVCSGGGISSFTEDEAEHLSRSVFPALNGKLKAIADDQNWVWVGGLSAQFDGHGYCSEDPWVVKAPESEADQSNDTGTYLPNQAGQAAYGAALGGFLNRAFHPRPIWNLDPNDSSDPIASGDINVVYENGQVAFAVPFASTGEAPAIGQARAIEKVNDVDDFGLITGVNAAMDTHASVAVVTDFGAYQWSPVDSDDGRSQNHTSQINVMQTAVRPNLGIEDVRAVQAPDDATTLVAGRETVLQVKLNASLAHQDSADLTVTVDALNTTTGVGRTLVDHEKNPIFVKPGTQTVILPEYKFTLDPGERVQATVTVKDPPGARSIDDADNSFTLKHTSFEETVESRTLRVDFAPVQGPGAGQTPTCGFVGHIAADYTDFASQAMPVSAEGVTPYLSCDPFTVSADAEDEDIINQLLFKLDGLAHESALDAVVGIIDGDWLDELLGPNTGGISSYDGHAILISSRRVDQEILAHELGHNFGLEHTDGPVPAHGWRVDENDERGGTDWMDFETHPKTWTSGATWDALAQAIGGPEAAPQPLVPTLDGRWVRGYVAPDGTTTVGAMLSDTDSPTEPADDSDTSRLKVYPIDADGNLILPAIEIGLSPVGTSGTAEGTTGSFRFAQRIVPPAGAVALRFDLDGDTVATKKLTASPTVEVTAPTTGAETGRGEQLNVAWTITDPDSDEFDTHLLVSDDNGAHWRPLSDDVAHNATSTTLTVPADLDGDRVKIRVVVTDGSNTTWADSGTIKVGAGNMVERVAFVNGQNSVTHTPSQIGTMNPDGSNAKLLNLPSAKYGAPVWDPQTGRLFMLGDNQCDVMSVNADGSDLRREDLNHVYDYQANRCGNASNDMPDTSVGTSGCLGFSASGQQLMVDRQVFNRDASGQHWTFSSYAGDSGGWNTVYAAINSQPAGASDFTPQGDSNSGVTTDNRPIACPQLSPDGKKTVIPVISYGQRPDGNGGQQASVGLNLILDQDLTQGWVNKYLLPFDPATVRPYDGPDSPRLQATPPGSISATWLDDHTLLVVQGSAEWDHAKLLKLNIDTGETTELGAATIPSETHTMHPVSRGPWGESYQGYDENPHGTAKIAPDGTTLYGDKVSGETCQGSMYTLAQTGGTASVVSPVRTGTPPDGGGGGGDPQTHQGIKGKAYADTNVWAYPVVDGTVSADYRDRTDAAAGDSFSLELPAGDYLIRWGDPDHGRTWNDGSRWGTTSKTDALMTGLVHVASSSWVEGLDYGNPAFPTTVVIPTTTVSGTITDRGIPVNGGQVVLHGDRSQQTWTDANGHYEFQGVVPGTWYLQAWGTSGGTFAFYGPAPTAETSKPIVIDPSATPVVADLNIPASFPSLSGGQKDADGNGFSTPLALFDADTKKMLLSQNVGDTWNLPVGPGRYLLAWGPGGSYSYWTGRSQSGTSSIYNATPIVVTDHDVTGFQFPDFSLPAQDNGPFRTGLGGHVYDEAGNPVSGMWVEARKYSSAPWNYGETVASAITRADGSWSVPLNPGDYSVMFDSDHDGPFWNGTTRWGFTRNDKAKITVADGQFIDDINQGDPDLPVARPSSGTIPIDTASKCQSGFTWGLTKATGANEPPLVIDLEGVKPDIDNRPDTSDPVIKYGPPTDLLDEKAVLPTLREQSFTIPAGVPSEIALKTGDGGTLPFRISGVPSGLHLDRATSSTDVDGKVSWLTGPDGMFVLTAPAGDYDIDVDVPGVPGLSVKVHLHVEAPPTPTALADTVIATIGEDHAVPVADLLGNDRASDGGQLHLITVGGYSAGGLYLDGDTIHIKADAAGGTFHYYVAEGDSPTYAEGTVTVRAATTTQHYTVRFAANGGTGAMPDQAFVFDVPQQLQGNRFTRPGYRFAGWNTKENGSGTAYRDGQQVTQLTTVDQGTVTLWAQWTKVPSPATPGPNASEPAHPGVLPSTGGPTFWLLLVGLLATGAGLVLTVTGRRRRSDRGA